MRTPAPSKSGSVEPRTVVWAVLFLALASVAVLLVHRGTSKARTTPPPPKVLEVSRTNLILETGLLRALHGAAPFNGVVLEHHLNGSLKSRSAVSNGLLHGVSQGWFTNGQMQVSENFNSGVSDGTRTKWYANGSKQSEATIVAGKINGTFRRWHTNGALAEQAEFVGNEAEGISSAWFPSGFLKARVVMKAGRPIEQTFWKDGERKE